MLDYDWNKKVPISATEFSQDVADAMKTEPFASLIKGTCGIEEVFISFSARVASILFEEKIRSEKSNGRNY